MCPSSLVAAVAVFAAAIAEGRSGDELSLLAAVFCQLGDTLATIAAQRDLCERKRGPCQIGRTLNDFVKMG